ncbi:MAG: hypothetical protein DRP84_07960 [Spirochaetes bacterium]|nr:MAG: hypothetical protein DRP84_07960 [Spirochaetota bacterium]HDK27528.1 class I SAM-dependent methyltransferase [Candidatus Atribacteria bacterium]
MDEKDKVKCPLCCSHKADREAKYLGPWRQENKLFRCKDCGTWFLGRIPKSYKIHFQAVGYNEPRYEKDYYISRYDFYRYIADKFVARYKISNWVEIGCGYGHLMEILRVYEYNIKGVEISEMLLAHLKQRGFEVYKNINDVNLVAGGNTY